MTIPAADWHRVYTLPVYVEHLLQAFLKKGVWNGLQKYVIAIFVLIHFFFVSFLGAMNKC